MRESRTLIALVFIGLAVLLVGTDPRFNVQNELMGLAAVVASIAALIPRGHASDSAAANIARHP